MKGIPKPSNPQRVTGGDHVGGLKTEALGAANLGAKAFQSIYDELQALLDDPAASMKVKGDAFEDTVRWLLLNDPTYGLVDGDVRLWGEAPVGGDAQGRLWRWHAQDTGTDLLAYPAHGGRGGLVAIQAKAWGRDHTVTKEEVDSFLADSNRPEVGSRIFATTSDRVNSKAEATITGQEKPVTLITFGTLMEAPVEWPASLNALREELKDPGERKKPAPGTLRPYQREVVKDALAHFQGGGTRGTVVMACGTGKTLTAQRLAEALGADRVLVLFPSLMLLKQTLQSWLLNADPDAGGFDWIAVCSDDTVAEKNSDHLVTRVADLGLPNVTTDPSHIQAFLKGSNKGRRRVVFSTYQSSPQIADALDGTCLKFDLMLCDEAHRMARVTKTSGSTKARDPFTTGLDDTLIPARQRVFLTATPKVYGSAIKKQAKDTGQEDLVASMDNPDLFGPVIATYTFKQAIEGVGSKAGPVLADYRVLAVVVTETELEYMLANRDHIALTAADGSKIDVTDTATLATQIAVIKAMENPEYGITSLISYHHTIRNAEVFQGAHNQYREALNLEPIVTDIVRGTDPAAKRPDKLRILPASKQPGVPKALVSNARCLTEGIDVPLLDGVAFVDPKNSIVDIVQAVGRAIRRPLGSGKEVGYVIVPIYLTTRLTEALKQTQKQLDTDDQVHELFADAVLDEAPFEGLDSELNAAFKPVIEVLRNLRSMDGALTETITKLKTERGARATRTPDREIGETGGTQEIPEDAENSLHLEIIDTPLTGTRATTDNQETPELAATTIPLNQIRDAIHLVTINHILDQTVEDWWNTLGQVRGWRDEFGWFPRISGATNELEQFLGQWLSNQRTLRNQGHLPADRAAGLESLSGWTWEAHYGAWGQQFNRTEQWLALHDGTYPSSSSRNPDEKKLAQWVSVQRWLHKKSKLSVERSAALEKLPNWAWALEGQDTWNETLMEIREWITAHNGAYPSATSDDARERRLGRWVIRQQKGRVGGELLPERLVALAALPGWCWEMRNEFRWSVRYREVEAWLALHGGTYPSARAVDPVEKHLGVWVNAQRTAKRRGKLALERVVALEALPGWRWPSHEVRWSKQYSRVKAWLALYEACPSARAVDPVERHLGVWVNAQRTAKRRGKLSDERIAALESLPGWRWSAR